MAEATQVDETVKSRKPRTPMTDEHKARLAAGREQGKAVRAYLEAIENHKPRRGRTVSLEQLQERLSDVLKQLATGDVDPTTRVRLVQERLNYENRIQQASNDGNLEDLEAQFIANVKPWAENQEITYNALREVGVPPKVLKAAGLDRKAS